MGDARSVPAPAADPAARAADPAGQPADPVALLAVARIAARAGADVALAWRERADRLRIEEKSGPADLVSQADREAESAIKAVLARYRPDDAVLGEEEGEAAGTSGIRWIIDPIDGTTSYLYGRADWSVSVAAAEAADDRLLAAVVAEPALGRTAEARIGGGTWSAGTRTRVRPGDDPARALVEVNLGTPEQQARAGSMVAALLPRVRDLRRSGSAAAVLAMVATGRADAAWIPGVHPGTAPPASCWFRRRAGRSATSPVSSAGRGRPAATSWPPRKDFRSRCGRPS